MSSAYMNSKKYCKELLRQKKMESYENLDFCTAGKYMLGKYKHVFLIVIPLKPTDIVALVHFLLV